MPDGRSSIDDIIQIYKLDVDVSLLRENLKLTPDERLRNTARYANFVLQAREAGAKLRNKSNVPNSDVKSLPPADR